MNQPRVLSIHRTQDDAQRSCDALPFRSAIVAYIGAVSPNPERPWAVIAPAADKKGNASSTNAR